MNNEYFFKYIKERREGGGKKERKEGKKEAGWLSKAEKSPPYLSHSPVSLSWSWHALREAGVKKRWKKGKETPQEDVLSLEEPLSQQEEEPCSFPWTPCASEVTRSSMWLLASAAQQTPIHPPKPNSNATYSWMHFPTPLQLFFLLYSSSIF